MDTFQKCVPISMGHLSEELYNFTKKWDQEDLHIATECDIEATRNDEEAKEHMFRKSYNSCMSVYVPTVNRFYLSMRNE